MHIIPPATFSISYALDNIQDHNSTAMVNQFGSDYVATNTQVYSSQVLTMQ